MEHLSEKNILDFQILIVISIIALTEQPARFNHIWYCFLQTLIYFSVFQCYLCAQSYYGRQPRFIIIQKKNYSSYCFS